MLVECYTLLASGESVHAKLEAHITLRYVQCPSQTYKHIYIYIYIYIYIIYRKIACSDHYEGSLPSPILDYAKSFYHEIFPSIHTALANTQFGDGLGEL